MDQNFVTEPHGTRLLERKVLKHMDVLHEESIESTPKTYEDYLKKDEEELEEYYKNDKELEAKGKRADN
ncbi:uncharacterized protein PFLUO_LOCUS7741 [Penicillium psychrofluorescens]|uniref:uncharacterized protein n=1 Tax=Penicillium psychrofluorescens TaxID=3158075 RepID=UPI003CCCB614